MEGNRFQELFGRLLIVDLTSLVVKGRRRSSLEAGDAGCLSESQGGVWGGCEPLEAKISAHLVANSLATISGLYEKVEMPLTSLKR